MQQVVHCGCVEGMGVQRSLQLICRENSGYHQNRMISAERTHFPMAKKGLLLQKWFALMVGQ